MYHAFYRQVPGGCSVWTVPRWAASTTWWPTWWPWARKRCWSATGRCATGSRSSAATRRVDFAEQWLAYPSAAPLVQLAHARALREDWVQPAEVHPQYLRKPDAEINWTTRESAR